MYFRYLFLLFLLDVVCCLSDHQKICVRNARQKFELMTKRDKITINNAEFNNIRDFPKNVPVTTLNISATEADKRPVLINSSSLINLDASNCFLENIDDIGYLVLPKLEVLVLSSNALTELKYHLFDNDNSLRIIDLSFNCLETFFLGHELEVHHNISEINLKANLLKQFKYVPRHQMFTINMLDLSWNQLTEFSTFTLVAHYLLLNNNNLSKIRYDLKKRNLETQPLYLEAQFNQITRFESPFNFSMLNLSHNSLPDFDSILISQVNVLDLSWNQIESKTDSSFYYDDGFIFNSVEKLDLEGNKINDSQYVKFYFPDTETINLNNNPLTNGEVKTANVSKVENKVITRTVQVIASTSSSSTELPPEVIAQTHNTEEVSGMSSTLVTLLVVIVTLSAITTVVAVYHKRLFGVFRNDIQFEAFDDRNENDPTSVEVMFDRRLQR